MARKKIPPPLSSPHELSQTEIQERIRSLRFRLYGELKPGQREAFLEEMLSCQDELMSRIMRRERQGR